MRVFLSVGFTAIICVFTATSVSAQENPGLELVFEETVTLGEAIVMGETARGQRQLIPITGGTFEGPNIKGEVLPMGWDWQLVRGDGCVEIEADYFLRTDDGVLINIVNSGVLCPASEGGANPVRTQPVFEVPLGKYEWLGQGGYIGTLGMAVASDGPAVQISIYRAN